MRALLAGAAAAACFGLASEAATYSFAMNVQGTAVSGSFEINGASPNYVGGGTTTADDLVTYSLVFADGSDTFTGTPANQTVLQNFDMTYSSDLATVVSWDFSLGWSRTGDFQFLGNNTQFGGFAEITAPGSSLNAFAQPAPTLTTALVGEEPAPIPLPAGLPLLAVALGLLGLAARRLV